MILPPHEKSTPLEVAPALARPEGLWGGLLLTGSMSCMSPVDRARRLLSLALVLRSLGGAGLISSLSLGILFALPQSAYAATASFTRASGTNANGYGQWTVPAGVTGEADFACWGGGAGGLDEPTTNEAGGGGGGGAFASSTISVTEGAIYYFYIAAEVAAGINGEDSIATTTGPTTIIRADAGTTSPAQLGGGGGLAANSTGTTKRNGGDGGVGIAGTGDTGGGGGGAAGPHAVGGVGIAGNGTDGGNGGQGDGSSGGTGGAGGTGNGNGQPGTDDVDGGGGGGGGDNTGTGGAGAIPGGGGGGGETGGGVGASGQCIVTYTPPAAPTVTTDSANSLSPSFANLFGSITAIGGAPPTTRGFAISTDSTLATNVSTTSESGTFGVGSFTTSTSTLLANTTYYYRAYAQDGSPGYGAILSFSTAGHGVARKFRLFEGFKVKLISNKLKLLQQ